MQGVSPRARLLGLGALAGLLGVVLIVFMLLGSSSAPKAQAIVPTKTPNPMDAPPLKVVATVKAFINCSIGPNKVYAIVWVNKLPDQKIFIGDNLWWKGQWWKVVGGTQPNPPRFGVTVPTPIPTPTNCGVIPPPPPTPSVSDGTVELDAVPPCPGVDTSEYPPASDTMTLWAPKPCPGGNLTGLFDVDAGPGLYHCIVRTDEDAAKLTIKSAAQCYTEFAAGVGAGEPPCAAVHSTGGGATPVVANEGSCNGHVDPPPYSPLQPTKLNGLYCPAGGPACTDPKFPTPWSPVAPDTLITVGCFADIGGSLGPNVVTVTTVANAKAQDGPVGSVSFGTAALFFGATNAMCTEAQNGIAPGPGGVLFPISLTRILTTRDFDGDGCTDMDELFADKVGSTAKCGDDPWNPYDPTGGSPVDVSGSYDITAEAVRADVGAPGLYYDCKADIQQSGKNLTARILCYIDSATITVNPQAASGNPMTGVNSCGPAAAKFCGDGLPGAAPPGCALAAASCATLANQGTGCPTLPCDVSQYQFADVDSAHTVLTGTIDNTANTFSLFGCFQDSPPAGDGLGQLGNVKVLAKIDLHTGIGKANIWVVQGLANCTNPDATGKGPPIHVKLALVRQAPGDKAGGCVANVGLGYTGCRDSDGDGCPDKRELGDTPGGPSGGGLRDPSNRWDYFNPEKVNTPHGQTVADILAVVGKYGKGQGHALYSIDTDRTAIIGGNVWNLGPADGQQTVADILAAVKQYNQNC